MRENMAGLEILVSRPASLSSRRRNATDLDGWVSFPRTGKLPVSGRSRYITMSTNISPKGIGSTFARAATQTDGNDLANGAVTVVKAVGGVLGSTLKGIAAIVVTAVVTVPEAIVREVSQVVDANTKVDLTKEA